jgi:ATP-dependent Clp protease ATP-binding subunit ClpA
MKDKFNIISKFKLLAPFLNSELSGQETVLQSLADGFMRGETNITNNARPKGNFLLLGPTGVGKTESILLIAEFCNLPLLRIDMSEFGQLAGNDVLKKLIGAPGVDTGMLGNFLDNNSSGIILYDEFEKAHPDLFTILLQQLDSARITLADYKTRNLSNFYIVCTSNVGAKEFQHASNLSAKRMQEHALDILRERFSPEFIGRFGTPGKNILTFRSLSGGDLRNICRKFLRKEINRLKAAGLDIQKTTQEFLDLCVARGGNTKSGARDMRHTVEEMVQEAYIHTLSEGRIPSGILTLDENGNSRIKGSAEKHFKKPALNEILTNYKSADSVKLFLQENYV